MCFNQSRKITVNTRNNLLNIMKPYILHSMWTLKWLVLFTSFRLTWLWSIRSSLSPVFSLSAFSAFGLILKLCAPWTTSSKTRSLYRSSHNLKRVGGAVLCEGVCPNRGGTCGLTVWVITDRSAEMNSHCDAVRDPPAFPLLLFDPCNRLMAWLDN